jgi:hypothetical protein
MKNYDKSWLKEKKLKSYAETQGFHTREGRKQEKGRFENGL